MAHKRHFSILVFLLLSVLVYGQRNETRKTIVIIDPGHGGTDSGAIGINDIEEKDIVLNIAKEMVRLNRVFKNSMEIYLTRYSDTLISLNDRTRLAKNLKADLFISLHCNRSDNRNGRGVEVYTSKKRGAFLGQSVYLAYKIEAVLVATIGFRSRGVKFANFQVLRELSSFCPVVLVEFAFLSNRDEAGYLETKESIHLIALSLLQTIKN